MIAARLAAAAILLAIASGPLSAADGPTVALEGRLKQPQSFDLAALRRLPTEQVQVSFHAERGEMTATYKGARLWAVISAAGGIDDDEKGAELRHTIRVSGRDGYFVVLSTGEIAPEFGGKPALIAYQRDPAAPGEAGLRLVIPGDKRGGRNVRDVIAIRVE